MSRTQRNLEGLGSFGYKTPRIMSSIRQAQSAVDELREQGYSLPLRLQQRAEKTLHRPDFVSAFYEQIR